ncbi:MAG: 50S ribosomal protein L3 [Deferribacteraceae bacterium]|jgi:large subunit ribosomal protein L3|nr:50S ribosomal protein L3 [Deferribacteraceae bacterium]
MVKGIIGKKIGMTQIFTPDGNVVPVTVVEAGPCVVTQKKTVTTDGYNAIQIGFETIVSEKKLNKPQYGHFKKAGVEPMKHLREIRMDEVESFNVGQVISADIFAEGDVVDIQGISIGKGTQGVMKRHNFAGGPGGHGSTFHRRAGSIGMKEWPAEVIKGKKMAGHMGARKVTTQRLKIVSVMTEKNIILIQGAIPGHDNGVVYIKSTVKPRRPVIRQEPKAAKKK